MLRRPCSARAFCLGEAVLARQPGPRPGWASRGDRLDPACARGLSNRARDARGVARARSPAAGASNFHLMKIREVATNPAGPESAYIELQMYAAGPERHGPGHPISFYTADGDPVLPTLPADPNVPNGDNQRTILIGDTGVAGPLTSPTTCSGTPFRRSGSGGAACFDTIDCVSWGAVRRSRAAALGTGRAGARDHRRLLALEALDRPGLRDPARGLPDDTGSSAADFALVAPPRHAATPSPRPKRRAAAAAETRIHPRRRSPSRRRRESSNAKAKLKFKSTASRDQTFMCKLDKGKFEDCSSSFKPSAISTSGKHKFKVFAIDSDRQRRPHPGEGEVQARRALSPGASSRPRPKPLAPPNRVRAR